MSARTHAGVTGVCVLVPSHDEPAGHAVHEVRVVEVPPAVREPAPQVAQLLAKLALNLVSVPHAEQLSDCFAC
jgi:hypothetical protein